MFPPARVGPQIVSDGAPVPERASRDGSVVGVNAHGYYQEPVYRLGVFSQTLAATSTGVAAGNIVAAAAAASTNLAIFNPSNSGKNLVILRFRMGIISGTPGAGPLFHGTIVGVPTAAAVGSAIANNFLGAGVASVAKVYSAAAGTALTGGLAPSVVMLANFASTATAQASPYEVTTDDVLDGQLIIPPGNGWLPLWGAAGTALLCGYSLTWEEIPV
jgi:hypothetical protein